MTEREQERAAIIEWLRKEAQWQHSMRAGMQAAALEFAADAIEAGDHLKGEK